MSNLCKLCYTSVIQSHLHNYDGGSPTTLSFSYSVHEFFKCSNASVHAIIFDLVIIHINIIILLLVLVKQIHIATFTSEHKNYLW